MLKPLTIILLFAAAWAVSRLAALVARKGLAWHDRRHHAPSGDLRAKIIELKRRETTVAVIRTGIGYVAFVAAVILAGALVSGGFDRLTTVAGASFVLILAGFAIQRILIDILAGFSMFIERWYSVGDTIEIPAVRVLPGGLKEFDVELVASDREKAERLVLDVGAVLPEGPTTFVHRPQAHAIEELAPGFVRLRMRTAVAPGREWLVQGFYADLLKERADRDLIVHGPVVLGVDERASRSFARASAATRWAS